MSMSPRAAVDEGLAGARRIVVYGVTGSGKSTLAARLGEILDRPWISVDEECWLPGWEQRPEDELRERFAGICAGEHWILDSAWGAWSDVALARADLVVGLDYSRIVSLSRLLRRTVARVVSRNPVCNGNVESLRQSLSRDSIIAWHFRSFRSKHARLVAWQDDPAMPRVLRLRTPAETEAWLASVRREREVAR